MARHDQLGGQTEDLLSLRGQLPAEHAARNTGPEPVKDTLDTSEKANRRLARAALLAGITLVVVTVFGVALIPDRLQQQIGNLVWLTAIAALLLTGFCGIAVWLTFSANRYHRAQVRQMLRRQETHNDELERLSKAVENNGRLLKRVLECLDTVGDRLNVMEKVIERVPAYGEGVILGAELRRSYVDAEDDA